MTKKKNPPVELADLVSVGPAALSDFSILGIHTLEELARCSALELYNRLCSLTNTKHDPCVEDVFRAAIEQAKNPDLEENKKQWFYWSSRRESSV